MSTLIKCYQLYCPIKRGVVTMQGAIDHKINGNIVYPAKFQNFLQLSRC